MIVESRPQERGRTNLPTEHLRQSPFKDAFDDQSEILSDEQAEAKSCLSKVICLHPEYDKAMAKILKRRIPLAVPVGMGEDRYLDHRLRS